MNMDYLEGDNYKLYMESWNFWTYSDLFWWRHNFWWLYSLIFPFFCLLLLSPIIGHQSALQYFSSSALYYWNRIRVLPGGYIIFIYHLIFWIIATYSLLIYLIFMTVSYLTESLPCSLKDNVPWLLLTTLFLEYKHSITSPYLLYLNRWNCIEWYLVDLFILGYRRYLDRGRKCLGVCV